MTHLEAQSYIMPFIEGKVPDNKQEDFVIHMKNCKKCHEELEIYYTLLVGMKQLDNRTDVNMDLTADLEKELNRMSHRVRNRRGVKISAFTIVMSMFIVLGTIMYAGILNRVYTFEQSTKFIEQGPFYYKDYIGDIMYLDDKDNVEIDARIKIEKEVSDYKRIRGFIRLDNDYNSILKLGEDLGNNEATTD